MRKIIAVGLMVILFVNLGFATTNVSVDVNTLEDVDFRSNINSNGTTNTYINGMDIRKELKQAKTSGSNFERDDLSNIFSEIYEAYYGLTSFDLSGHEEVIANALYSIFVDRKTYENKIRTLEYRIETLENAVKSTNKQEYCEGKIEVMFKHNISDVECGNHSITNEGNGEYIAFEK